MPLPMKFMNQCVGPRPRCTDKHVPHIHSGMSHVTLMVMTLMATMIMEPFLWAGR